LGEEDDDLFAFVIDADPTRIMSTVSVLEASIVIEARKGPAKGRELDLFLHRGRIDMVAFNAHQLELARDAYRRYGKRYHRAALNFGDCCAYALDAASGEPLLSRAAISSTPTSRRCFLHDEGGGSSRLAAAVARFQESHLLGYSAR
jgi:ribonuclease VapC